MKFARMGLVALSLFAASSAMAWVGFAASGNATYVADGESRDQAGDKALAGCRESYGSGCELAGVFNAGALVVARGNDGQWGFASRREPTQAVAAAIKACSEVAKGCKVTQALWDPGLAWAALAWSEKTGYYVHLTEPASREAAEAQVLALCRKGSQGDCKLETATTDRGYVAIADSDKRTGYSMRATAAEAQAAALATCEQNNSGGQPCKVRPAWLNDSQLPEPASMGKIKAEAERNWTALKRKLDAAAAAPAPRKIVRTSSESTSVQRLTCSNRCVNGTCERTFSNGRKETWYPPRVFNQMTGNWDFDINTNACGG